MSKLNGNKTALTYVLLALIPYTKQNLKLAFKPNLFFDELDTISGYSQETLRLTYNRAKKQKIFTVNSNSVDLSLYGRQIIQPFIAEKIDSNGQLMVIFDVPEDFAHIRRQFRNLLRQLEFKQVQQSVWISDKDHREILTDSIKDLGMQDWVQLYEAARIS